MSTLSHQSPVARHPERRPSDEPIRIRGLRVHNLKNIDLDIPRNQFMVISGVSGSGKSSLAFDTLFAEGQRRYIETFSSYTRQFLERIDRPDADSIENIPPALAVRQRTASRNSRSTVGSITEVNDFVRLLLAKIGRVYCLTCGSEIASDSPASGLAKLAALESGTECLIAFDWEPPIGSTAQDAIQSLRSDGFIRVFHEGRVWDLGESVLATTRQSGRVCVVVDRVRIGTTPADRLLDSLETAFANGSGRCRALISSRQGPHRELVFSRHHRCETCNRDYPEPEPRLFNSNNPRGACPVCRGFGDVIEIDMDRVVPDRSRSIRTGAIAPWNTPAYAHELKELLALASDYDIPVDRPISELTAQQFALVRDGVPERDFGGLHGFFQWLERHKYKMHVRVFLSRWRGYRTCTTCNGRRLRDEALATRLAGKNIAEILATDVRSSLQFFEDLTLSDYDRKVAWSILQHVTSRLKYLDSVGLGYLTLDRPIRTLSGGESQRVALTKALGSGLVNTLYVLDEPSIGLHERDTNRLVEVVRALRDAHNSVVVVEHDEAILNAADYLIDMGPGAGANGGRVLYQGPRSGIDSVHSPTADYLLGRRRIESAPSRRAPSHGWIQVRGARGNNLKNIDVNFPLRVLCVVTGVSGSGKSTLVEQTLVAGLNKLKKSPGEPPATHDSIDGVDQIGDVVMVDQQPIGHTSRSNPVTYVKAFQEIRRTFADSTEARMHNYGPGHFSFNVDGGRCSACQGQGVQVIDMQFLADIAITCPECAGLRYRKEILSVKYRGKNIAEVLDMTVAEAMAFFRGRSKLCGALAPLAAVGLEYIKLGQSADTLSGGEAQRLKLAGQLVEATRERSLLVLDEPTTGLHAADVAKLLDCFNTLLDAGHSLVVVEHNMDVIQNADWIIDLGPEASDGGGSVVSSGTPEKVAKCFESHTGAALRRRLPQRA